MRKQKNKLCSENATGSPIDVADLVLVQERSSEGTLEDRAGRFSWSEEDVREGRVKIITQKGASRPVAENIVDRQMLTEVQADLTRPAKDRKINYDDLGFRKAERVARLMKKGETYEEAVAIVERLPE